MIGMFRQGAPGTALLLGIALTGMTPTQGEEKTAGVAEKTVPNFTPAQIEFFEKKVRPVLAENCLDCHSGTKAKLGLQLNHREGWLKGSDYRKVIDLKDAVDSDTALVSCLMALFAANCFTHAFSWELKCFIAMPLFV
jgi:hypothetical protein